MLTAVALVTSKLASGLRAREADARAGAEASATEAEFAALLARQHVRVALDEAALAFLARRFGEARLFRAEDLVAKRSGLAPLDAAAAAWALHNEASTGHASEVMPSADFRFVPLDSEEVLALAVAGTENTWDGRTAMALARIWRQARDRIDTETERNARRAAEQRESVRRALLAALGHDFRTPLTILKAGLAEIDGGAVAGLEREVDRLSRMSENLIAAARLEHGQPAQLEPVDLVDVLAAMRTTGRDDGAVDLRVELPDDLPLVRADPVMLVHLIGNLLDNALRHARSIVIIAARAEDREVRLEVRDDGVGLDPAIAGNMFDRFVAGADRHGGSGLGLSIAADLARAIGASLVGGEAPEGGACFTLRLGALSGEGLAA